MTPDTDVEDDTSVVLDLDDELTPPGRAAFGIAPDESLWTGSDLVIVRRYEAKNASKALEKLAEPGRYTVALTRQPADGAGWAASVTSDEKVLLVHQGDDGRIVHIDQRLLVYIRSIHETFELRQDGSELGPIGCFDAGSLLAVVMPIRVSKGLR